MSELGKADEIAKLADLKEKGLLSDKDFERQRRRVLRGDQNRVKSPWFRGIAGVLVVAIIILLLTLAAGSTQNKPVTVSLSASRARGIRNRLGYLNDRFSFGYPGQGVLVWMPRFRYKRL